MSQLVVEILLRLSKIAGAALIGLVLYLLVTGPFGAPGSAELAILAFTAGAAVLLLVESSPI